MKMDTLHDLYVDQLKDLYNAENQLVAALPKMAKASESEELREAFNAHLEETKVHVERIDTILKELGESPKGKTCKAMEGLIAEGKEVIEAKADPAVKDAGLICAAQKVEHYEIAGYGCVRTFARQLGYDDAADLLDQTLDEESNADETLTGIAEGGINEDAEDGAEDEEEAEVTAQR